MVMAPRGLTTLTDNKGSLMKIHEYQAKEILRHYGVVTPRGIPCFSVAEAITAAKTLGGLELCLPRTRRPPPTSQRTHGSGCSTLGGAPW